MKRKCLYLLICVFCMSAFASSEECTKREKGNMPCNNEHAKSVTGEEKLISDTDVFELTPVRLLLFDI
jgi:hypothetical protein